MLCTEMRTKVLEHCRFDAHPKHKKKSALEAELAAHFDEDMAAWLLKEMMQNRSRKLVKKKVRPASFGLHGTLDHVPLWKVVWRHSTVYA